jgi:hypothetical protein
MLTFRIIFGIAVMVWCVFLTILSLSKRKYGWSLFYSILVAVNWICLASAIERIMK